MTEPQNKTTCLKMKGILTAIAIACASLLSGCSFLLAAENSDPYTPDDVIDMVASEFAVCQPHLILQSTEREKDKPSNETSMYSTTKRTISPLPVKPSSAVPRSRFPVPSGIRTRISPMLKDTPGT